MLGFREAPTQPTALGRAENGTLLVVVHTYREINEREALVRLISARPATKREQQTYEAGV